MSSPTQLTTSETTGATEEFLISADSHVTEPADLWEKQLPASLRERAPNFKQERHRGGRNPIHLSSSESTEMRRVLHEPKGGGDPGERLKDMTMDGVSAEILYPSRGARMFFIEDPVLQEACVKVYNDWLTEFCKAAPDRLYGLGMISTYNIDYAVKELERCKKHGLCGAVIWQLPPPELPFTSDHYDRLWAAAQDMEMPVSLHILTGYSSKHRRDYRGLESYRFFVNTKVEEITRALFDIIFSGVLDRFPGLKLVSAENEIGWIPYWLEQGDMYFERHRSIEPMAIDKRPSEYFYRQIFATFFNDAVGGSLLGRWIGVDNCMWSNDYPHSGNMTWPYSREVIARDLSHLAAAEQAKLVRGNVVRLYKLKVPNC